MSKFKLDYDFEEDLLFLYDENKKSKGSIEFGELVVDLEKNGKIVALEIFDASKYFTDLTDRKITRQMLSKIENASFSCIEKKGTVFVKIILPIEKEQVPATIAIQNIAYKSPIMAHSR
ncbi:MAG: DUF2283 domain-containing protein [Candidatus ainarchaeum sp.]|nr:DUF2283 domain-containing protein [Candidatus ainarchaeum sp.]